MILRLGTWLSSGLPSLPLQVGRVDGTVNGLFTSPDSVAASITGIVDIQAKIAPVDWTPATTGVIASKYSTTGANRAYLFALSNTGALTTWYTSDGINGVGSSSTVATGFADGTAHWVRTRLNTTDGTCTFYTSEDGVTWAQLGGVIAIGTVPIIDTNARLEVGAGFGGSTWVFEGDIYRAKIIDDATLVADFNPSDYVSGTTFDSRSTGETWTLNGTATIVYPQYNLLTEGGDAFVLEDGTTYLIPES